MNQTFDNYNRMWLIVSHQIPHDGWCSNLYIYITPSKSPNHFQAIPPLTLCHWSQGLPRPPALSLVSGRLFASWHKNGFSWCWHGYGSKWGNPYIEYRISTPRVSMNILHWEILKVTHREQYPDFLGAVPPTFQCFGLHSGQGAFFGGPASS